MNVCVSLIDLRLVYSKLRCCFTLVRELLYSLAVTIHICMFSGVKWKSMRQECKHASLGKYRMHGVCVCVSVCPTWSVLHILTEGLELRLPDCRVLVEDDRAAQPLGRPAQPLGSQLLSVVLPGHREWQRNSDWLINLLISWDQITIGVIKCLELNL